MTLYQFRKHFCKKKKKKASNLHSRKNGCHASAVNNDIPRVPFRVHPDVTDIADSPSQSPFRDHAVVLRSDGEFTDIGIHRAVKYKRREEIQAHDTSK